jgi:predicted dehydrogenase
MDGVEIAAFVDVVPEGAQQAAAKWGGKAYTSVDDMFAAETIDAAWLCIPPFAHGEAERTCIDRHVPMYIEKPVGTDLAGPEAIAAALDGKNLVVNVGYYWRCMEVLPKLRGMLAETPPKLVRIAYHGPTAPAAWWRRQSKSGGQVVEQATHLLDTARHLLGEAEIIEARADHTPRPDYPDMDISPATAALLRFYSGPPASFTSTCVLSSFVDTAIEFLCEGRKITLNLKELHIDTADGRTTEPTGEDPLVLADRAFIAAVKAKDPAAVPCNYTEALATQRLCYGISEAARKETKNV